MEKRPGWAEYFMGIAREVSKRATCDRLHVGAVIVRGHNILATGYNGSVVGEPHCDEVGHDMEDGHCVRTVHAEANAICQAAKHGARIDGSALFTTAFPCWPCFRLALNAGVRAVVFGNIYRPDRRILPFGTSGHIGGLQEATYWIAYDDAVAGPFEKDVAYDQLQAARKAGGVGNIYVIPQIDIDAGLSV
jgi:dCMP deaminase